MKAFGVPPNRPDLQVRDRVHVDVRDHAAIGDAVAFDPVPVPRDVLGRPHEAERVEMPRHVVAYVDSPSPGRGRSGVSCDSSWAR